MCSFVLFQMKITVTMNMKEMVLEKGIIQLQQGLDVVR